MSLNIVWEQYLIFLFHSKGTIRKAFLFFKKINLFTYFWLCWVFVAACGLSLVVASGGYSLLWCAGFSLWWLLLLWSAGSRHTGSVVVAHGLQ